MLHLLYNHNPAKLCRHATTQYTSIITSEMMDDFKALTYPRLNMKDNTLDENLPSFPSTQHTHNAPQTDIGWLGQLPLELFQAVLLHLDLRSLINFRMVNRRGCLTVDSIPQFSSITKHAQVAIQAALAIQTAPWITCERLYDTLCTIECKTCGDFAGYIYMLTCERVCFLCLSDNERFLPYDLTPRKYKTLRDALCDLPHMKSIPGRYCPLPKKCSRRFRLWDRESARSSTISMEQVEQADANTFDGKSDNKLRFMAIVEVPVLDPKTGESEQGRYCLGCKNSYSGQSRHFRRRFNEHTLQEHVKECGPIVDDKNYPSYRGDKMHRSR